MAERAIAAYGKLPLSKEFLRHGCYEGAPLKLKNWLDGGHDKLAALREPRHLKDGNPRRFFLLPAGVEEGLLGVSSNSRDASNERRFPFVVFTPVAGASLVATDVCATALQGMWSGVEREHTRLSKLASSESFYHEVRAIRIDAVPASAGDAKRALDAVLELRAADWVKKLYPADGMDLLVMALWRLNCLAPSFASYGKFAQLSAFRLPLAADAPRGEQVDLWRSILRKLHRAFAAPPTLVFSGSEEPAASCMLMQRPPEFDDFPALLGEPLPAARFTDLTQATGKLPSDGYTAFREKLEHGPLKADARLRALADFAIFAK